MIKSRPVVSCGLALSLAPLLLMGGCADEVVYRQPPPRPVVVERPYYGPQETVVIDRDRPPAPLVEVRPPPPRYAVVWVPGHWRWDGYRHVWIRGHYRRV